MKGLAATLLLGLLVSGCGAPEEKGGDANSAAANQAAANGTLAAAAGGAAAEGTKSLASCPFRETEDWHAFVEGGRLQINGKVDLLMAGFKPMLTRRAAASPGTAAFDLSLVQEADAAVSDRVRFSEAGVTGARSAEIYCENKRIAKLDLILVD